MLIIKVTLLWLLALSQALAEPSSLPSIPDTYESHVQVNYHLSTDGNPDPEGRVLVLQEVVDEANQKADIEVLYGIVEAVIMS